MGKFKTLDRYCDKCQVVCDEHSPERYLTIWLVWALDEHGNTTLHAITTTNSAANYYRKLLKEETKIGLLNFRFIKVWVEKAVTNHLFGYEGIEAGNIENIIDWNEIKELQKRGLGK